MIDDNWIEVDVSRLRDQYIHTEYLDIDEGRLYRTIVISSLSELIKDIKIVFVPKESK